ncbi:unnamed protein product [Commensalibacter communis]|uniref:hypothetical protein n=1 Tax=Commensalibacter communis TaxID=2972786 RepID=UPI0022FF6DD8|nr:hypothetical protein [Commensalibacter communis]CAI3947219.1 unnamed protein product [Commensalibacter communis]
MKKILIVAGLMALPICASAANTKKPLAFDTIEAASKRFSPPLCQGDIGGLINAVSDCYENTDRTSPDIQQCILADIAITSQIMLEQEKRAALGKPDISQEYPFVSWPTFQKRFNYYVKPQFPNKGLKQILTYYKQDAAIFLVQLTNSCKKESNTDSAD